MAANSILAKMAVQITANTAQFNAGLSETNKRLLGFEKGLGSLKNSLGLVFGGVAVFQGIKAGISIIADFEKSMSEVKAITGATGDSFNALRNDALELGKTTQFTAKEVSQLQVAYGRLGFTTKEILGATKATLALSAATGEDLAKSADVAGSTVRAFNKDASETINVADIMAKSFNESALGLENFSEAIKYVAPVAANANISLEQTTALLGVLADNGIRGSQAGTSLRKIISDLGQGAGPVLTKRLNELAKAGLSGADAMDEVGRTAYASLLILSKNTEKVDAATRSYQNAKGAVEAMASVMQDNLSGDITKLTSAWQGLILSFSDTGPMRSVVQSLTTIVNAVANLSAELDLLGQALSPFRDLKDVDKGSLGYLLKSGRTDTGKDVKDVLKPITGQDNEEFFANVNKNLREFISLLIKEGESVEDATTLWQYYLEQRVKSTAADAEAARVAREAAVKNSIGLAATNFALAGKKIADGAKEPLTDIDKLQYKIRDLGAGLRSFGENRNINYLTGQLKELNDVIKFSVDANEVSVALDQIKAIEAEIAQLGSGLSVKAPNWDDFVRSFTPPKEAIGKIIKDVEEFSYNFSGAFQELGQAFGEFIADMNNGVGNIEPVGERIKKLIGGLMQSVGGALIAYGSAQLALKFASNPYVALAAGVALVAAGAALSKSANNAKKAISGGGSIDGGGSSGSGSSGRIDDYSAGTFNIIINDGKPFEFSIAGDQLRAMEKKSAYVAGRR